MNSHSWDVSLHIKTCFPSSCLRMRLTDLSYSIQRPGAVHAHELVALLPPQTSNCIRISCMLVASLHALQLSIAAVIYPNRDRFLPGMFAKAILNFDRPRHKMAFSSHQKATKTNSLHKHASAIITAHCGSLHTCYIEDCHITFQQMCKGHDAIVRACEVCMGRDATQTLAEMWRLALVLSNGGKYAEGLELLRLGLKTALY